VRSRVCSFILASSFRGASFRGALRFDLDLDSWVPRMIMTIRRRASVALVVLALVLPSSSSSSSSSSDASSVDRRVIVGHVAIDDDAGGAFIDSASRRRVLARGANAYWLRYASMGNENERTTVEKTLEAMVDLGLDVVRTWAFMDGDETSFDGRWTQRVAGEFDEDSHRALDALLVTLREKNLRVILTLTNYWPDYGGIDRYVGWARRDGDASANRREDFYTSPKCRAAFEAYVEFLVGRRNSVTGELYRDDPTIFSYQLINEPRVRGDESGGATFAAWAAHFASVVRRVDGGRHLVSVGTEGFFAESSPRASANPYAGAGRLGVDVERLRASDSIDFACVHVWTDDWMDSDEASKRRFVDAWIAAHLEEDSNATVKPVIFEEFGKHRPLKIRDDHFERVFRLVREHDATHRRSGALFWLLAPDAVEDYDGFSVFSPSDASTLDIIRREVASIESFLTRRERGEDAEDEDEAAKDVVDEQDDSNVNDDDDDVVVVEFPEVPDSKVDVDVRTSTSGLVRSYACRMSSNNPRGAHATYGDRVVLEFAVESTAPVDVSAEFAGRPRARVAATSSRAVTFANDSSREETTTTTYAIERILGEDDAYVDEGPMTFQIFVARRRTGAESSSSSSSSTTIEDDVALVVDAITEGTTVVFDSTAPYLVDAFLRPYVASGFDTDTGTNALRYGDVAVLYAAFSEPVEDFAARVNGREAFVSAASPHGDAHYAYVEIERGVDVPGDEISFAVDAVDRAGVPCYACKSPESMQTTDGSALVVVAEDADAAD